MRGESNRPALVVMRGIVKDFPGVRAIDGTPVELRSPRAAIDRGIGMGHQHFRLIDRFTVAENVTLGWHMPRALVRPRPLEREIAHLSNAYRMAVDPGRPIWQLSVGEQQRVEILKNLHRNAHVLVLDEPTAVLTHQEAEELFASLRAMAGEGRGVVFISHKLREVMAVADRVTVLRRGRVVATVARAGTSQPELARLMFGHELPRPTHPRKREPGEPVLVLSGLQARDERGLLALRGTNLEVH